MNFSDVKTPKCPDGYTLHRDRRTLNSCKCVRDKNARRNRTATRLSSKNPSSSRFLKVKQRFTVKNKGRDGRCPSGTRYNKSSGMCEKRHKKRSFLSAVFKERSPDIKIKRKQYSPKRIAKRTKCPDGYFLNKQLNVCERRTRDNYYAKFAKGKTAKAKTARGKTAKAKTAKAKTAMKTKQRSKFDRYFGKPLNYLNKKKTPKTIRLNKTIKSDKTAKRNQTLKKQRLSNYKTLSPVGLDTFRLKTKNNTMRNRTIRNRTMRNPPAKTVRFNKNVGAIRSPGLDRPATLAIKPNPTKRILKNRIPTPPGFARL